MELGVVNIIIKPEPKRKGTEIELFQPRWYHTSYAHFVSYLYVMIDAIIKISTIISFTTHPLELWTQIYGWIYAIICLNMPVLFQLCFANCQNDDCLLFSSPLRERYLEGTVFDLSIVIEGLF